jgi:cold shock CspA family protein
MTRGLRPGKSDAMRAEIVRWFPDRGYGFAKPEKDARQDLIVHAGDVVSGVPYQGATIEFEFGKMKINGQPKAANVRIVSGAGNTQYGSKAERLRAGE